jgi:hypothetical protein
MMLGDVETPLYIPNLYIWRYPAELNEIAHHQSKP